MCIVCEVFFVIIMGGGYFKFIELSLDVYVDVFRSVALRFTAS